MEKEFELTKEQEDEVAEEIKKMFPPRNTSLLTCDEVDICDYGNPKSPIGYSNWAINFLDKTIMFCNEQKEEISNLKKKAQETLSIEDISILQNKVEAIYNSRSGNGLFSKEVIK